MEHHVKVTVFLTKGDTDCCEFFPTCSCSEDTQWAAECPECGGKSLSSNFLGPYDCTACDFRFYPLVEGWVDKRDGEEA